MFPEKLSAEQLKRWEEDGCLYIQNEDLFSTEIQHNLIKWVGEVQSFPEIKGKWMKYYENSLKDGTRILNRIENFLPYHKELDELVNGKWMQGMVSQLFGEEAVLYKEKINFKLPGGEGFKPHQDVLAGWDEYGHTLHISVAICIDEANEKNGCLECVLGEHKKGLLGPMFHEIPQEVTDKLEWVSYPMQPGDMIIFDSYTPHRSGPNLTESTRRMIFLTYNKISEGDYRLEYYQNKRKNFPPDIEREDGEHYEYKI